MKKRIFTGSAVVFIFLFAAMFSGCLGNAGDESVLPEEQESELEVESVLLAEELKPEMLLEVPEGIHIGETKILGDKAIIILENTVLDNVYVSRVGIDVAYEENSNSLEHFEKEMNSYIEAGKTVPVTIRIRKLSDWQDSGIRKIEVIS